MTRTGIKLDLDIGDLVSNAGRARGAISSITEEMKKAEKENRWDDWAKLKTDRDRLERSSAGYDNGLKALSVNPKLQGVGANGQPVFKMDAEYAALIKDQTAAIKKLTAEYAQAVKDGDITRSHDLLPQLEKQQQEFKKIVDQTGEGAARGGMAGAVKAIGIDKLSSAINQGFSAWAGSLNRSGIINQYGNGDVLGGRISEQRRQADMWGGFAQAGLGIAGTAAGFVLPGGPLVWGTIGTQIGSAVRTALGIAPDLAENNAAQAGLWQQKTGSAMQLAALTGDPSKVRETWKEAAGITEKHGFSAEEGAEALKAAAQQGLGAVAAEKVFDYERRTGADRGVLSSVSYLSGRYGGGDALRAGWAGLEASGMKTAQYSEYLRAMQRVMEDGISKGFSKSSETVAQNLTMLAQMTNNNPLWVGEQGANRLMKMNSGLEGTTGLQSSSDMIAFRAAKRILGDDTRYEDILAFIERGGTGRYKGREYNGSELLHKIMEVSKEVENGDRSGVVEILRSVFGFNYNEAISYHDNYRPGINGAIPARIRNRGLPDAGSPELEWAKVTQEIVNAMTINGQKYWDEELPKLYTELERIRQEIAGTRPDAPLSEVAANETRRIFGGGYASQVQRILEEEEANRLQSEIMRARGSTAVNSMFFGGRAARGSQTPAVSGLFDRGEGEDLSAAARLQEYRDSHNNPQAQRAFLNAVNILNGLSNEERQGLNNTNAINRAIPSVATDPEGHLLLEQIRDLLADLNINIDIP